jgi:hypothetical protein
MGIFSALRVFAASPGWHSPRMGYFITLALALSALLVAVVSGSVVHSVRPFMEGIKQSSKVPSLSRPAAAPPPALVLYYLAVAMFSAKSRRQHHTARNALH